MKTEIKHKAYDLGLGFELGVNSAIRVSTYCLMESRLNHLNLFWEIEGAPKPILLIQFDDVEVARLLDEMWHSTETQPDRWTGIDGSFARVIEGCEYPTGSDLLSLIAPDAKHYAFITDGDCVDVIARSAPRAKLIKVEQIAQYRLSFPLPE